MKNERIEDIINQIESRGIKSKRKIKKKKKIFVPKKEVTNEDIKKSIKNATYRMINLHEETINVLNDFIEDKKVSMPQISKSISGLKIQIRIIEALLKEYHSYSRDNKFKSILKKDAKREIWNKIYRLQKIVCSII